MSCCRGSKPRTAAVCCGRLLYAAARVAAVAGCCCGGRNPIRTSHGALIPLCVLSIFLLLLLLSRDLIPVEWIRLFNPQELQRLIGGEGGRAIDVEDLKRNTLYAGGYHQSQPVMKVCAALAGRGHYSLSPRDSRPRYKTSASVKQFHHAPERPRSCPLPSAPPPSFLLLSFLHAFFERQRHTSNLRRSYFTGAD